MDTNETNNLTIWQRQNLGYAIEELGKGCLSNWDKEVIRSAKRAKKYLDEFLNENLKTEKIDDKTAELSSNLHTFLRKGCDGGLSVILYRMIDESRGMNSWLSFCKNLLKYKMDYNSAFHVMKKETYDFDSTDEVIMRAAIDLFEADFKFFNEWTKQ